VWPFYHLDQVVELVADDLPASNGTLEYAFIEQYPEHRWSGARPDDLPLEACLYGFLYLFIRDTGFAAQHGTGVILRLQQPRDQERLPRPEALGFLLDVQPLAKPSRTRLTTYEGPEPKQLALGSHCFVTALNKARPMRSRLVRRPHPWPGQAEEGTPLER